MTLSAEELRELREIFDHYDSDGNGVIDPGEFRALLAALDPDFTEEEIRLGLQALDIDGNGVIDREEFADWWANR